MNADRMKELVRKTYGEAAARPSACCGKTDAEPPGPTDRRRARSTFGCGDPLSVAGVMPGQRVVDVGSGPGLDALAAARRVGPFGFVLGVDMTEAMIDRARRSAEAAGLSNVEFRLGDAESLPAEDGWADWVISNCVVNLVPDKRRAFAEIFRVLKPGGRLSITDLIGEDLPAEVLADAGSLCSCIGGAPSERSYLEAMRGAGFDGIEVVDRFAWEAPELAGTGGKVWSLKIVATRPA